MSWTTADGSHEGWAAPVLLDGRYPHGSVGRRDPDNPDRVVLGQLVRDSKKAHGPEEFVPDSEVAAWVGQCACGWSGQRWERVTTPEAANWAEHRVYDTEGGDAPSSVEDAIHAEWKLHVAPHESLDDVRVATDQMTQARARLDAAVERARAAGASWTMIGRAAGTSRQSAHERWG